MKAKDQISFYDAVRSLDLEDLKRIKEILLDKKTTDDSRAKLAQVEVVIEEKEKRKDYMEKLWGLVLHLLKNTKFL